MTTNTVTDHRRDLLRYLDGDHDVPRSDDYGTPCFVDALWDDLAEIPDWALSVDGVARTDPAGLTINPVLEVPFGTYAWRVRRLQKTVQSVIR